MTDILPEERAKITGLISVLIPDAKIYLFGSRARGTHSPRSDIDIAVDLGKPTSRVAIDEAKSILQASNLIYRVDVVDLNQVDDKMRSIILKEGILWKA